MRATETATKTKADGMVTTLGEEIAEQEEAQTEAKTEAKRLEEEK